MNVQLQDQAWSGANPMLVVFFGNEQTAACQSSAEIQHALERAGVDCVVIAGNGTLPAASVQDQGEAEANLVPPEFVELSVVLPVFDEQDNIPELHHRLTHVMTSLHVPYELVFVDDGSRDGSPALLLGLYKRDPHVRVVSLTRNFGQQQAVSAGIAQARGRAVVVMDADLQDPPEVIPEFIAKWREGYQVVYAVREKRKEHLLKRTAYHTFYLVLRRIVRIDIPLDAGDFCLMDRCVVNVLTRLPERKRFVRGLRSWVGFRQVGLAFERNARHAGKPKYTFKKLVSLALDGLISFSYLPLRLATLLGFGVSALSLVAAAYYLFKKLTTGLQPPGFATLVVLLLLLGGVQLITIGVMGEYIGHVLDEVKGRPAYVVREVLDRHPV